MNDNRSIPAAPSFVQYGLVLGMLCSRYDELRRELHLIGISDELTDDQKDALGEPRFEAFRTVSGQISNLAAVHMAHITGMSDEEASAYLLKVADGALSPAVLPPPPATREA